MPVSAPALLPRNVTFGPEDIISNHTKNLSVENTLERLDCCVVIGSDDLDLFGWGFCLTHHQRVVVAENLAGSSNLPPYRRSEPVTVGWLFAFILEHTFASIFSLAISALE